MAIDKETIENKLRKLDQVIAKLEECKKVSEDDFMIDFRISDAAMYNLVQGIEIIIDIGNHILSEVFHIVAEEYAQVIEKLGETKVVPQDFAKENIDMAKFRNLIIHAYEKIDLDKATKIFRKHRISFVDLLNII